MDLRLLSWATQINALHHLLILLQWWFFCVQDKGLRHCAPASNVNLLGSVLSERANISNERFI